LNHAGAAAKPKASGSKPKAPSSITCPASGQVAESMDELEIREIIEGYRSAAEKAVLGGFDAIEIQGGHSYLISQFLNRKINKRTDIYGQNRLKFAQEGIEVIATKRTDPIGSMMEMITKKLTLMRIEQMPNVTLMPHTTVKSFDMEKVEMETDGEKVELEPFDTVILASGMRSAPEPDDGIRNEVTTIETIGDAKNVMDIYTAVHAGYELALKY
jgi:hypothetical protein